MPTADVVPLHPYVAKVDISFELLLTTITTTLHFGPFPSRESASEWCARFSDEHERLMVAIAGQLSAQAGDDDVPPFVAYAHGTDVVRLDPRRGDQPKLIPPRGGEEDAHRLNALALAAGHAVIEEGFRLLREDERA